MTPTPETLNELADRLEHVSFQGCVAEIALIRAAADAWDAQIASWWAAVAEYRTAMAKALDDEKALRTRLEAAEKLVRRLNGEEVDGIAVFHLCAGCLGKLDEKIEPLRKRLEAAEKVVPLIRAWREKPYTMSAETVIDLIDAALAEVPAATP